MSASEHPALVDCQVVIERPVTWGSMDAFQHVNNTYYFSYFEDVRIVYFERAGIVRFMEEHQIGPILASTQCRFKFPLRYPDTLWIGTSVFDIGTDRFSMRYVVVSQTHQRVAAEGEGLVVCYDYKNHGKTPLPSAWKQAFAHLS